MSGITPEDFLRKAFKKIVADAKAQESKLPENITETLQSAEEKLKDARAVLIKAMRENKVIIPLNVPICRIFQESPRSDRQGEDVQATSERSREKGPRYTRTSIENAGYRQR